MTAWSEYYVLWTGTGNNSWQNGKILLKHSGSKIAYRITKAGIYVHQDRITVTFEDAINHAVVWMNQFFKINIVSEIIRK